MKRITEVDFSGTADRAAANSQGMSVYDETWLVGTGTLQINVFDKADKEYRAYVPGKKGQRREAGALVAAAPEMYRALVAVEQYTDHEGETYCPACNGDLVFKGNDTGLSIDHKPDCILAAALRKAEGK